MQLVRIYYVDGSIKDIELPYIPFDHERDIHYSESMLELRHLNEYGVYLRRTINGRVTGFNIMDNDPDFGGNLIIPKSEYDEIECVKVDGEVILESDEKGGLVRPSHKLAAESKKNETDVAEADFSEWKDVLG